MGADGHFNYFEESLPKDILKCLVEWLTQKECPFQFEGSIFEREGEIWCEGAEESEKVLFTKDQLLFVGTILCHIQTFCNSQQTVPDFYSQFQPVSEVNITRHLNYYKLWEDQDATDIIFKVSWLYDRCFAWYYSDNNGHYYYNEPFENEEQLEALYEECKGNGETTQKIFPTFTSFENFIRTLPTAQSEQLWT